MEIKVSHFNILSDALIDHLTRSKMRGVRFSENSLFWFAGEEIDDLNVGIILKDRLEMSNKSGKGSF